MPSSTPAAAADEGAPAQAPASLALERFLPYRLSYTAGIVSEAIAAQYRDSFGLSIPEWRVLAHIAERSGITQQEIGLRARMDKVAVSRATLALRARGLIARRQNPLDRRSRLLLLSKSGRGLYAAIAPRALELERAVFRVFSPEELAALAPTQRRLDEAAARALGERP